MQYNRKDRKENAIFAKFYPDGYDATKAGGVDLGLAAKS